MGYKRKTYVLVWPEGHEFHGLEVVAKGLPVKKLTELAPLVDVLQGDADMAAKADASATVFAGFAERLVSWNLEEDDGTPVPATLEGVNDQDTGFMIPLIIAWMGAAASVDIPLPSASPDGATTATEVPGVASIPVETLSSSLLS